MPTRYFALLDGGPFHGEHELLGINQSDGPIIRHAPGSSENTRIPHLYTLTDERRQLLPWKGRGQVAKYTGAQPEEITPKAEPKPMPMCDARHLCRGFEG